MVIRENTGGDLTVANQSLLTKAIAADFCYARASTDEAKGLDTPQRLYGRDAARAACLKAFSDVCGGEGIILLVPGLSGVGKTSLIRSLGAPVRAQNGFFLEGKFNQYQQNIPFYAVRKALAALATQLDREQPTVRRDWQAKLQHAAGGLGRLLVELVPDFAPLVVEQPPVPEISPLEARHRFAALFRKVLSAVCQPEHPLVLFLDDWQWADTASLELLRDLQIGTALRYVLLVAAYRADEVDAAHPLAAMIGQLHRQAMPIRLVEVHDLALKDVSDWLCEALQPAIDDAVELAAALHSRTRGNPFFTQALLSFLRDAGWLRFDEDAGCWSWRRDVWTLDALPNDAVELFQLRLQHLETETRDLLGRAACLGDRFDVDSLAAISGRDADQCALMCVQVPEVVVALDGRATGGGTEPKARRFMFAHDRIQQAAYGLIPPQARPALHLDIGQLLLAKLPPDQAAHRMFEIADHLNRGHALLSDVATRVQALQVNIAAARKARNATAYAAALQVHRAAARFLADPDFAALVWRDHHALALSLCLEQAETEFLEGDRTRAEACILEAVSRAASRVEKAEALAILVLQNTLLARYPKAIEAGREALRTLGVTLPECDYEQESKRQIDLVQQQLAGRTAASLADLPVMSDPTVKVIAKILITMGPPCYRSHQRLWGVIVPMVVNLTLKYGNIPEVGYSHPAFAGLLCWAEGDFALAKQFGEVATHLMTRVFSAPSAQSVYYLMLGSSTTHWFSHLAKSSEDYANACQVGLQSGNLQYSAYALGHNMYCRFYQGTALCDLIPETDKALAFSRTRLNQWAIDLLEGGLLIFSALSGDSEWNGEREYLNAVAAHENIQVQCIYQILKAFYLFLLGRYEDAFRVSEAVQPLLYTVGMQGLLPWPQHEFVRFLIVAALPQDSDAAAARSRRAEMSRLLAQIRIRAQHCPENYDYQRSLAEAELARLENRPDEAIPAYENAMVAAHSSGFVQFEGIAAERAARFFADCGQDELAHSYWLQAYACFAKWGANAKLAAMERDFARRLSTALPGGVKATAEGQRLIERQVGMVRTQLQSGEDRLRSELETRARELACAADNLRAEVAAHKRTEQALRESEERYRTIVATAMDGLWVIDANWRILEVNETYCRMTGYTKSEVVGRSFTDFRANEPIEETQRRMERIISDGEARFESELRCKDGRTLQVEVSVQYRPTEGGRFVGFLRDITARREADERIRRYVRELESARHADASQTAELARTIEQLELAKHRAEAATRAKSAFLSSMSHEIRTPLCGVIGTSELLQYTALTPEQRGYVNTIRTCGEGLLGVLNDVLDFSKIEAGKLKLEVVAFDLHALLADVLRLFAARAHEKHLELGLSYPPYAPKTFLGDPGRIRQVTLNLVGNAVKFTEQGGIRVEVCCEVDSADCARLRIDVHDTGIGIPEEAQTLVFQHFEQLDSSTTRRFGGTGLGLAISNQLVELMGGKLSFSSEVGHGSTFSFEVPLRAAPPVEPEPQSRTNAGVIPTATGRWRVLLVEDNTVNQRLCAAMLSKLGCTVDIAANGREALNRFRSDHDLVFMDCHMPEMDGYEATRALRTRQNGGRTTPIIALTAGAMEEDRERCIAAGMDDFVTKPFLAAQLSAVLEKHLVAHRKTGAPSENLFRPES